MLPVCPPLPDYLHIYSCLEQYHTPVRQPEIRTEAERETHVKNKTGMVVEANTARPLQLVASTGDAAYSKYIDALPYADEPMTEAERFMVQRMIDDELRIIRQEEQAAMAGTGAGKADGVTAEGRSPRLVRAAELVQAPPSPPAPSTSAIDLGRYSELGGVENLDAAKVTLEYEMGRRLEAQLRLKYGALRYRESNEGLASVLQGVEEGARVVAGDVGMINRERKRACDGVREELGRLGAEYIALVRKNAKLKAALDT